MLRKFSRNKTYVGIPENCRNDLKYFNTSIHCTRYALRRRGMEDRRALKLINDSSRAFTGLQLVLAMARNLSYWLQTLA